MLHLIEQWQEYTLLALYIVGLRSVGWIEKSPALVEAFCEAGGEEITSEPAGSGRKVKLVLTVFRTIKRCLGAA